MILLDVGGPFLLIIPIVFILFMIVISLLEGWIMSAILKRPFKSAFGISVVANIVSLIFGWFAFDRWDIGKWENRASAVLLCFILTYLIETLILFAYTRGKQIPKVLLSSLVMNLCSYTLLILILYMIQHS